MVQLNDFGKAVKKKLIDLDKNQTWLINKIKDEYPDLYFDNSYLQKLMTGRVASLPMEKRIKKILGID